MGMNVQETLKSPLVWHPQTAADAWQLKQAYGSESVYTAGGTLLRTQWESGLVKPPRHLINLSAISNRDALEANEKGFVIGSQVTLQQCRNNVRLEQRYPMITEAMKGIAAPSIRHLATIGGNILSMVGDSLPALLIYDGALTWFNGVEEQEEELSDWLQVSRHQISNNDRILLNLKLPLDEPKSNMKQFYAYHKVGRREAFTPSVVTVAVSGAMNEEGRLSDLRIALGGGQTIACRLEEVERETAGAVVDTSLLEHVYERTIACFDPKGDVFASADYRKKTAANLIVTELWKAFSSSTRQGG